MKSAGCRIAVGQISSESNHFVPFQCELDLFRTTGYLYEKSELFQLRDTDTEVAGFLARLQSENDVEIVPLLAARANSSGPLSTACYRYLRSGLLERLKEAGSIDGVLLSHHGSMAAAGEDDPEGDIVARVREIVGPRVPIVMTLDLHGNVTARMVQASSAILGYEHYPHDDTFQTGERGADLLVRTVRCEIRPVMAQAKLPLLLTAFRASTQSGPFGDLMQRAKESETHRSALSTSMFLVGSYLDMPDLGCSSVVVSDGNEEWAQAQAYQLAQQFWARRQDFLVETYGVAEAVHAGREIAGGPILLLDTADTTGGGAAGDGVGLLRGLLDCEVTEPSLLMVVDPEAARTCQDMGVGREVTLRLGHQLDPAWGTPLDLTGKIERLSDGRFRYWGGILGGTWACMGPSAVLRMGSIQVLISTFPTYDWADEQYQSMGMDPTEAKFVGVKNMMNFRIGYRDVMKGFFVLDLPGPTPPDMRMLPFHRVSRPLFPLDPDLTDPQIRLHRN